MNIEKAKEAIKDTIEAYLLKDEYGAYQIPSIRQRPVLVMGPPGVGKTQIMEQVARECKIGLAAYTITHHTRQSAIGLPCIVEREYGGRHFSVTEYTMSEIVASIYDKIRETGLMEGILFLDEINCVSETLAPAMLQLLQCKTFGTHAVPEGWLIVAAGNPPEYNKSVRDFDVVTLDRVKLIQVEADFEVWKAYAYQQSIHPAILSYLNTRKESFCRIETTVDGHLFATPRGWEDLSRLMEVYERLNKPIDRDVIGQYLQFPKIAGDFANYLELYDKYRDDYQADEILSGVIRESMCSRLGRARFDEKLSVMSLLLSRLNRGFQETIRAGDKLELLQEELRRLRDGGSDGEVEEEEREKLREVGFGETMEAKLCRSRERLMKDRKMRQKAGLLSRRDDYLRRDVVGIMEGYERALRLGGFTENEKAWERIKGLFDGEQKAYEAAFEKAGRQLECVFDFFEAAFGSSQEMALFITELNTGQDSVRFLREYECPRYFQYNEGLLFNRREDEIKERIKGLKK